jgi:hypothetical protein
MRAVRCSSCGKDLCLTCDGDGWVYTDVDEGAEFCPDCAGPHQCPNEEAHEAQGQDGG